ncbi:MAG TPA: AcvB/VirJ family lysyl-phosphatidylglycerol hydrolase [Sphingobium sp.]|nr:AcvB/VirJ family lysyl-phosphatidylglycerol hydrolase [Sphingobium sp.]
MRKAGTVLIAAAMVVLLFFTGLGYFDRDPFSIAPPTARPAPSWRGVAAIILSGDMGSKIGTSPPLAKAISGRGIPVVMVNSLAYFRVRRTAAEAEALLHAALQRALSLPHVERVVMIGQSYGADMLQVGLSRLPPRERSRILFAALVVPGRTVEYRASPGEIFTFAMAEEDALPAARRLDWLPLLCIYGKEERQSLCPLLHSPNVRSVALPGGHLLHHDSSAVLRELLPAIGRHITQVSRSAHIPNGSAAA